VRNADDWPVRPEIGHSAVKRPDDIIQTDFNEPTELWRRGLFNVKRSIANIRPTCVYGR